MPQGDGCRCSPEERSLHDAQLPCVTQCQSVTLLLWRIIFRRCSCGFTMSDMVDVQDNGGK